MKKLFSLLKVITKGDMNIFKFKTKKESISKILFPLILCAMVFYSMYYYASFFGDALHEVGLTYILLSMFSIFIVLVLLTQGLYKSQGILFDAKDNNLLFSLPIEKKYILAARIIKLMLFEYMFELLFLLPAYLKYILLESPSVYFYLISVLFLILLPIIPTIIACVIGYVVKFFSTKSKNKNLAQIILSFVLVFIIMYVSFNLEGFLNDIVSSATSINDIISRIYLPIGLYINLIQNFDVINLIGLIVLNLIPFALFIYVFSYGYDRVINESKEVFTKKKTKFKELSIKSSSRFKSLLNKELKKYFSSPMYLFNTIFGIVLLLIITVGMCINLDDTLNLIVNGNGADISLDKVLSYLPQIYLIILLFMASTAQITASSISLEGKKIELLKTLPLSPMQIFNAKIMMSNVVVIPLLLISSIIFIVRFELYNVMSLYIIGFAIVYPTLMAIIGLLINLRYPKLEFTSETEVVKQSASSVLSVLVGMIIPTISLMVYFRFIGSISANVLIGLNLLFEVILVIFAYIILKHYGVKKFNEL